MTLGRYPREPLATDGELLAKNPAGQPRADALVERLPSVISVNRSRGKFWTWVMEAFRHSGIVTQRPSVCPPQNGALNSVLDPLSRERTRRATTHLQNMRGCRSLSRCGSQRGRDAMVNRRTTRLVDQNRELLAQVTHMRLEAKEQARKEWLQRAREQAARIANRAVSSTPRAPSAVMQRSAVDDLDQHGADSPRADLTDSAARDPRPKSDRPVPVR